jgi:chemotaxis methyl-accepting protein methylase
MDADNPEQQQKKQSTALRKTAVAKRPTRHAPKQDIYIAALGSSAGGLEASEQFYRNLPANTGIGFVMIPHLAPEHKGLLTELLQHYTEMKVMQAVDGTKVLPNCVYVIPPNKYMTIMHGTLQLLDITTPHGVRMPIDFFLRHLADDQGDKAIGIILSGMGTDGSLGIQAIKENFGMTMVQDTQSAKFEGMPRSAADTGLIDYVLPAESMPAALVDYVNRSGHLTQHKDAREQTASNALQKIYSLLRAHTGNDFSFYKSNTVMRRIERRMGIHQLDNITHYVRYLQDNPQELDLLFKEFLIGVTSFFRDPEAFESLCKNAIPELLLRKAKNDLFRVWVPGCSTGQEAYSIAILLRECLDTLRLVGQVKIQIFATDIDETTIETARQGLFPANIVADVTPKRLKRFFTEDGSNYRINKEVRETVVFAPQNLLRDPPFTRLDLLSCRNLLIYLTPETQQKLFPLFHYALNADGILFLGSSETISNNSDLFEVLDAPNKTFRRKSFSAAVGGLVDITTTPIPYGSLKPRVPVPIPQDGGTALPELTNRLPWSRLRRPQCWLQKMAISYASADAPVSTLSFLRVRLT